MSRRSDQNPVELSPLPRDPLVSIIIPIFNERDMIERVLERVRALPFEKQLVLVDDCSDDGTAQLLDEVEACKPGTIVVHHERNQGKGAAIRTGLKHIAGHIVLIQDADLEYSPEDIPPLVDVIVRGEAPVVYGSRFRGRVLGMRLPNRIGNWILAWTATLLYGRRITDEATAYKVFRSEVILSFKLACTRFEFCPEVTARTLKAGWRIKELPVSYTARTFEEGKKIGWRDFITAMKVLVGLRFHS